MRHFRKISAGRRGTALLLAILILSQVTVAAIGLGTLVVSSLQQARLLDNSIAAYYAAESSVEQAIYTVRRDDIMPDSVDDPRKAPLGTLGNGAKWERTVSPSEKVIVIRLRQDAGYELDLIDFDEDLTDLGEQPVIDALKMDWDPGDCAVTDSCPVLEVSAISFDPNLSGSWEDMAGLSEASGELTPIFKTYDPTASEFRYGTMTKRFTAPPASVELTSGRLNIIRLRSEGGNIDRLTIRAFSYIDGHYVPTDIPGRVRLDVVGRLGGTEQRLSVKMPRRPPLMGLYTFAVFSECSLVKGHPIRCP